jgi:hypothetical protein
MIMQGIGVEKQFERDIEKKIYDSSSRSIKGIFEDVIKTLPNVLSQRLIEHYSDRIKRANGQSRLGEQAVSIFSDLLSISKKSSMIVETPWLLLYEHALLIDDLLDVKGNQQSYDIILSQILLDKAYRKIIAIVDSNDVILQLFESYRQESWAAMVQEIEWSERRSIPKSNTILIQQGRKAALAKFCATLLFYVEKKSILTSKQEKGIDLLCSGIQMLDDLDDFLEDYEQGRRNFILHSAIKWLRQKTGYQNYKSKSFGPCQLHVAIILSFSVNRAWTIAAKKIKLALALLDPPIKSKTTIYFNSLYEDCIRSSSTLLQLVKSGGLEWSRVELALQGGESLLSEELASGRLSQLWREICNQLTLGPKCSN